MREPQLSSTFTPRCRRKVQNVAPRPHRARREERNSTPQSEHGLERSAPRFLPKIPMPTATTTLSFFRKTGSRTRPRGDPRTALRALKDAPCNFNPPKCLAPRHRRVFTCASRHCSVPSETRKPKDPRACRSARWFPSCASSASPRFGPTRAVGTAAGMSRAQARCEPWLKAPVVLRSARGRECIFRAGRD